jgi:5-methyltetrahydropteroyltriglutamate--homocysteine methyltransferase
MAELVDVYADVLCALAAAGVTWVQLDEPAYVADRTTAEIEALHDAYTRLCAVRQRPRIFVATYFGELGDALSALLDTPVEALGLDLVAGPGNLRRLAGAGPLHGKTIVAGLVDGRNVWRTDLRAAITTGAAVTGLADHVAVSTSCSLLHTPVDLAAETTLDPQLRRRLAFARQKVDEVVLLGRALRDGTTPLPEPLPPAPKAPAAAAHHDHRLVSADRRAAGGPRRTPVRPARRLRLRPADARRGRACHPAPGTAGPRRTRARRAGAQRHGPVLR